MSDPVCSIVIPTYNGRDLLATCLASLARHRPAHLAIEIIVADDASTDDTPAWLAATYRDVRQVRLPRNQGFCAAANAGIDAARGRFIQMLNNDAEVTAGWLEAGLAPFDAVRVGSVAPLVLMRRDPARVDSAGDVYSFFGRPTKRGHGQPASRWLNRRAGAVLGASGSSAFYRCDALRTVGGFDPSFGSYYEDVDLAFRLRWAGFDCVYEPKCRILHDVSATYDHSNPELQRRLARNAELLFWSNLPPRRLVLAVAPHFAFLAAQFVYKLSRGRAGPFLAGKLDAWRRGGEIPARRHLRRELAHQAVATPRFPLRLAPWSERPGPSASRRRGG